MPSDTDKQEELALQEASEVSVLTERQGEDDDWASTAALIGNADRLATIGKLSSYIAHELGTPLNVISGQASMVAAGEFTPEETKKAAQSTLEQTRKMTAIIRRVLGYARNRAKKKEKIELSALVSRAVAFVAPVAKKKGAFIEVLAAGDWPIVEVDIGKLLQVLTNLLTNGIQAMPKGGKLTVRAQRRHIDKPADSYAIQGNYLCVSVQDEGVGISEEQRAQLFEPFFTTKPDDEGTGLGLWISQGIVREHGGFIEVQSEVGRGSCFTLCLPPGEAEDARTNPNR